MSKDKLAGNYLIGILFYLRKKQQCPFSNARVTAGGVFSHGETQTLAFVKNNNVSSIRILMRPLFFFFFLAECHAPRSLVTLDVIVVIEFQ